MTIQKFYLVGKGEGESAAVNVDVSGPSDMDSLRILIAGQFAITAPESIAFQQGSSQLETISDFEPSSDSAIGITVDGVAVREVPGPKGAPWIGDYFGIFPDHLGNNERMFRKFGPVFQTTTLGRKVIQVNDPKIALIVLTESDFFSKIVSNPNHPLHPLYSTDAGVFISDTDTTAWRIVHKFLPPCLGPKAVRHYAPLMNQTIAHALPVFDQLESGDQSWNVYQYMLKLGSQAIGKLVLDMDFGHFEGPDAPMHPFVYAMAESLSLNKKVASKTNLTTGDFYASLPFGDPQRLRDIQKFLQGEIGKAIERASSSGSGDLELENAALEASNVIGIVPIHIIYRALQLITVQDYLVRATDHQGNKLPQDHLLPAVLVAAGAGFTTTSTLLSWLIYGLVTYPGMQARLLQELVDHGFTDDTEVTPEMTDNLKFQQNYIKEMQRLHNPSYQPGRAAKLDCILPGGYRIHEGDVVIAALHHIHTNAEWWENAARFDPDRWDKNPVHHKAQYIPFATGQRMCIGFNFALQEVKIFLPKLVWRYHWTKEGETAVEYDPFFQLIRPVNLYVNTQRRTEYPSRSDSHQA